MVNYRVNILFTRSFVSMEMNSEREKQRTIIGHDRISDVCVTSRCSLVEKLNVIKRGFVAQNLPRL